MGDSGRLALSARRWYERAGAYKVAAVAMLAVGAVLAWFGPPSFLFAFLPFLGVWIGAFFGGLILSKVVRQATWGRQTRAAALFLLLVLASYLPVLVYRATVAGTLAFPLMAALQGLGTAIGFYAPWLYGEKASHEELRQAEDFLAAIDREK